MGWKRKMQGGLLGWIGFMLSPLSWWNDLFVNLPLAVAFGWLVALVYRPAFETAVIIGYWLTNLLGFVLLHKGAQKMLSKEGKLTSYSRRDLFRDFAISLLYTLLLVALVELKFVQPPTHSFPSR